MPEFSRMSEKSEDTAWKLDKVAEGFAHPKRAPILLTPMNLKLDFEDVTFPAADGVLIKVW